MLIHGLPSVRWAPGPDVGGCGVFLGDLKAALTRTVFIGDTVKDLPNLRDLDVNDWCMLRKLLAAQSDTFILNFRKVLEVLESKRDWGDALDDMRQEFNDLGLKPTGATMPYEWIASYIHETRPDVALVIRQLKYADPDTPGVREMRKFVHLQSTKKSSLYACPGLQQIVEDELLGSRVVWQDPLGTWHYDGRYPGG